MKIHRCTMPTLDMYSPEWMRLRTTVPSASEFDQIITPKELKVSKSIRKYVARKLCEKWLGGPLQSFSGGQMDQGTMREHDAKPWYAAMFNVDVDPYNRPGSPTMECIFITDEGSPRNPLAVYVSPDSGKVPQDAVGVHIARMGCSPDFLVRGMKKGGEVKCPEPDTHVRYLWDGKLPDDYRLQVQGSMLVTGFDEWDFVSFHPQFPKFVVTAKRERDVCDALLAGIAKFWDSFDEGWEMLLDANGGPPPEPVYEETVDEENGIVTRTLKPTSVPASTVNQVAEMLGDL